MRDQFPTPTSELWLIRYLTFIENRSLRKLNPKLKTNRHHILPRSLGGNELVTLSIREHYIAHMLLYKAYENSNECPQMVRAFHIMIHTRDFKNRLSSKDYERVLTNWQANFSGKNNPMYGRTGESNPMYGRFGKDHPMFNRPVSEETRRKRSNSMKQAVVNRVKSQKGISKSAESIEKRRQKVCTGVYHSPYGDFISRSLLADEMNKELGTSLITKHLLAGLFNPSRTIRRLSPKLTLFLTEDSRGKTGAELGFWFEKVPQCQEVTKDFQEDLITTDLLL